MVASCWVARKIRLSVRSADSRARTEDSRPITNGTIMKGKITTSRIGTIGSFVCSYFSFEDIGQLLAREEIRGRFWDGGKILRVQKFFLRPKTVLSNQFSNFLSGLLKWKLDLLLFDH